MATTTPGESHAHVVDIVNDVNDADTDHDTHPPPNG